MEVEFKEINLKIKIPDDIDCYSMAIRGLWLNYDHHSDQSSSYEIPKIPEEYQLDMGITKINNLNPKLITLDYS